MSVLLMRQPLQFCLHLWLNIGHKVFQRLMFPMEHHCFSRKGLKIITVLLGKPPGLVVFNLNRPFDVQVSDTTGSSFCFISYTLYLVTLHKTTKIALILFVCSFAVCVTVLVFMTGLLYIILF